MPASDPPLNSNPTWDAAAASGNRQSPAIALLCLTLLAGCEHAFEPFQDDAAPGFSMWGYLDLYADTQWIRVMPIRHDAILDASPIDAVVTLEDLETGKVVTLRDSIVGYTDAVFEGFENFEGVGYAHNFWTTERLRPLGSYRLKALRSDGAETTALVSMPEELEFDVENEFLVPGSSVLLVYVRARKAVFVDMLHLMPGPDTTGAFTQMIAQKLRTNSGVPNTYRVLGAGWEERAEMRITTGSPSWPFSADLSDFTVSHPGRIPSNVDGGYGFVGGVAARTVPLHLCEVVVRRPSGTPNCAYSFNIQSASIEGKVMQEPCGTPHKLQDIRLIERFADGGVAIRHWKTGLFGEYRFEGIAAGTDLIVEVRSWDEVERDGLRVFASGPLSAPPLYLGRAVAGQRTVLPDISVSVGCP